MGEGERVCTGWQWSGRMASRLRPFLRLPLPAVSLAPSPAWAELPCACIRLLLLVSCCRFSRPESRLARARRFHILSLSSKCFTPLRAEPGARLAAHRGVTPSAVLTHLRLHASAAVSTAMHGCVDIASPCALRSAAYHRPPMGVSLAPAREEDTSACCVSVVETAAWLRDSRMACQQLLRACLWLAPLHASAEAYGPQIPACTGRPGFCSCSRSLCAVPTCSGQQMNSGCLDVRQPGQTD